MVPKKAGIRFYEAENKKDAREIQKESEYKKKKKE